MQTTMQTTVPLGTTQTPAASRADSITGSLHDFLRSLIGDPERIESFLWAAVIFFVALAVASLCRRLVRRFGESSLGERRLSPQHSMLLGRGVFYGIVLLGFFQALRQAGFDIGVLLGAAGIVTVALGFAAQTSASNLISGLFLMGERPFVLGDAVQVGSTVGEVVSIDLLSVKLRTFDNLLVRMPNESLLKSEITNLTRHPIRRLDIPIGVAYSEDPERVRTVLEDVAEANELCLDEPAPIFFVLGFGDSAIQLRYSAWTTTVHFFEFRTRFLGEIKRAFDAEGVEFPFPQQTLTFGEPVEVRSSTSGIAP